MSLWRVVGLASAVAMAAAGTANARIVVVADGLDNPSGLAVSWSGRVFVAEAGHGGDRRVEWLAPFHYALAGNTGRVSMLLPRGGLVRHSFSDGGWVPIVSGLPSVALGEGGEVVGPSGLAFRGNALFAGIGAAVPGSGTTAAVRRITMLPRAIWEVDTWPLVQELTADDLSAASMPYGLTFDRSRTALYIADTGANAVLRGFGWRYTPHVFKAWDDNPMPTAVAFGPDGCLYVSMLGHYPFAPGSARIERVHPDGQSEVVGAELTALTDIKFDRAGRLYAVQVAEFDGERWLPNTGAVLRIDGSEVEVVAGDLNFPNKIAFGRCGELYITVNSAYSPPNSGQVVMIAADG